MYNICKKPGISTSISCYMVRPGLPYFGVFSTMPWDLKTGSPRQSTEMRSSLDSSLTRFPQCVHTDLSLRASMMATNHEMNLHHQCHCFKSHLPIVVPAFGMGTLAMGSGTAPVKHVDLFYCSRQPRIAWNRPVGEVWLAGAFVFSKTSVSTQAIWENRNISIYDIALVPKFHEECRDPWNLPMAGPRQFKTPSSKHVRYVSKASIVMTSMTRIDQIRYLLAIHLMSSAKQLKDFNETGHITISILATNVMIFPEILFQPPLWNGHLMLSRTFLHITIGKHFLETLSLLAILSEPVPPHERLVQLHFLSKRRHRVIQEPLVAYQADGGWSARNCSCPQGRVKIQERKITSTSSCCLTLLYALRSHVFTPPPRDQTHILHQCCLRVIPLIDLMLQIWVQFRMIFGKVAPAQQNATAALKDTLLHIMVWEIFNPGQAIHAGQDG